MERCLGKRFPIQTYNLRREIIPRNYQMELAEPGLQGENYICVAPTGSGKTLVAAIVIADHLQRNRRRSHVLFIVNTKPLAEQQKEKIKEYIDNIRVGVYFGDCRSRVADSLTENNVSVCTAGKLLNELQQELVKFSQFSLVIFDECHHTMKSHAYAEIMKMYLYSRKNDPWLSLQIVGMTASPGAGSNPSLNESKTVDHMVKLMAFLDANGGIKTVQENCQEFWEYTRSCVFTQTISQSRDPTTDRFINEVDRAMRQIEAHFDDTMSFSYPKWSQEYETKIQQKLFDLRSRRRVSTIVCDLQHLCVYSNALNMYMELRDRDAIEIIEHSSLIQRYDGSSPKENLLKHNKTRLIQRLKQIPCTENPMLKRLKQALVENFQLRNSRAILFVRTKKHTQAIQQWIHEDRALQRLDIIPVIITGQGEGGMTQAMQKDVMKKFREGRANLLIATSVAEEGLDVPECNIVIRYQYASNEIAKEQTEGRARAQNSSGYAISSSSKIICQEKKNEELVKLVKKVLDGNFLPTGRELRKRIDEIQREILWDFQPKSSVIKSEADIQSDFRNLKLQPRNYQIELAGPGLRGQNYICVAPTGSGKTLVAAMVIADHLQKNRHKKNCHVLFIVNTRPLADQQKEKIKDYIMNIRVGAYVGDKAKSSRLADSLRLNEVSVCTAGKLRNELYEGKVKFSQFSLVIFDECHHTIKSHPYAEIMRLYLLIKKKEPSLSLQIIGMTASPGAGGSNPSLNESKAINHMVRLMAFLDAKGGIKTVRENLQELREHTRSNFFTCNISQSRDPTTDPFVAKVVRVMEKIEACFHLEDIKSCGFLKWSQEYETRIRQKLIGLGSTRSNYATICGLQHLCTYSIALNTYMELQDSDAIEDIENSNIIGKNYICTDPVVHQLYRDREGLVECLNDIPCSENPMLKGLKQVLVENFQKGNSRAIVFVRTKKHTQAIQQWIYENDDFTRLNVIPVIITGQGDGGMTQAAQKDAIGSFREGRTNLLIATSVAEEGLDIPECNVVIRYQYTSNEIAKEQTEGRARAQNSSGYTISDSSKMTNQEIKNEELVKLVKRILEDNCLPTGRELRQKIEEIQEELS